MLIANPTYDTTFKYLMDDQRSARIILGALLGRNVVDVRPINNDIIKVEAESAQLLRLDFAATISEVAADGTVNQFTTTIELQKALSVGEVARFRKYLGHIYLSDTMAMDSNSEPLHIVTIYILGHCVDNLQDDITYISPTYFNRNKERIEPQPKSSFAEKLVHEAIIVQIPKLTFRKESRLDKALSVFKVSDGDERKHVVNVEEIPNDEDFKHVLNVLSKAVGNAKFIQQLEIEEELRAIIQARNESAQKLEEVVLQNEKVMKENVKMKKENSKVKEENEKLQEEKAQAEKTMRETLRLSVTALRQAGLTDEAIASTLKTSVEIVKEI